MTIINVVYASAPAGEVIIPTLEIKVPGADPIRIAASFKDITATLETEESVVFTASHIEYALPARDGNQQQTLRFGIPNATAEAQKAVDLALESDEETEVIYREFLSSDLSSPATQPLKMTMIGGEFSGIMLQVEASYYDILNTAWPREVYTQDNAPGLKYL